MKQEILSKIARLEIPLFLLKQYIPNANFLIENGDDKKIIKGFSIDSRAVQKDFVFLALEGENFDGHSFLSEVKKNHAIGAIVKKQSIEKEFSELVDKNFFLISVDNVLEAFGKKLIDFQTTKFTLAELKTELKVARIFIDQCINNHLENNFNAEDGAMAKYWSTELQCKIIDTCLQLHGGYGYMWEYPIARAYADARVQKIYGGTNEIMKELISRSL